MPTEQQVEFAKRIARLEKTQRRFFGRRPRARHESARPGSRIFHITLGTIRLVVTLAVLGIVLKTLAIYGMGEANYRAMILTASTDLPGATRVTPILLPDPVTLSLARELPR